MGELMRRTVEKEYCSLSCNTYPAGEIGKILIMGLMWNQGMYSWFECSQVGVERGLFFS